MSFWPPLFICLEHFTVIPESQTSFFVLTKHSDERKTYCKSSCLQDKNWNDWVKFVRRLWSILCQIMELFCSRGSPWKCNIGCVRPMIKLSVCLVRSFHPIIFVLTYPINTFVVIFNPNGNIFVLKLSITLFLPGWCFCTNNWRHSRENALMHFLCICKKFRNIKTTRKNSKSICLPHCRGAVMSSQVYTCSSVAVFLLRPNQNQVQCNMSKMKGLTSMSKNNQKNTNKTKLDFDTLQ